MIVIERLRSKYHHIKKNSIVRRLLRKEANCIKKINMQEEVNILLLCHALEKGMGINNVKYGYGQEKALQLIRLLKNNKQDSYAFKEGSAVINKYIEFQKKNNVDIKNVELALKKLDITYPVGFEAGYRFIEKQELELGKECNFETLISTRHSIRKYSTEPILVEEMEKVIENTLLAPSACNRQPCKLYYSLDIEKNKKLSKIVPGNNGFADDIPYYCAITVDRSYFSGSESLQWYINGGIFAAYFILSLHSVGIGSCIFQWPVFYSREKELRDLIGLNEEEGVVAIIGYGKYPDKTKCIMAQRKSIEDVVVKY